jgi:hypothetical protein
MYDEIALTFVTLVKILFWVYLEYVITHLETNRLHFRGYILTWLLDVAESFVRFAVKIWESRCPLSANFLKYIRWN